MNPTHQRDLEYAARLRDSIRIQINPETKRLLVQELSSFLKARPDWGPTRY